MTVTRKRVYTNRAFTLIEMLVTITIIGVCVAFILPAIQGARSSAQRIACTSNLRQIGLAILNLESVEKELPPFLVRVEDTQHSWVAPLLPYIEQTSLANHYNFAFNWDDKQNQAAVQTQIGPLLCPSAGTGRYWEHASNRFAAIDYTPISEVNYELIDLGLLDPWKGDPVGPMTPFKTRFIAQITDGMAQTILIAEDAGRPQTWITNHRQTGQTAPTSWASPESIGRLNGSEYDGTDYPGPCSLNCNNNSQVYGFHPNGANAVFSDGHVQFLRERLDIRIMAALVTRAGNDNAQGY